MTSVAPGESARKKQQARSGIKGRVLRQHGGGISRYFKRNDSLGSEDPQLPQNSPGDAIVGSTQDEAPSARKAAASDGDGIVGSAPQDASSAREEVDPEEKNALQAAAREDDRSRARRTVSNHGFSDATTLPMPGKPRDGDDQALRSTVLDPQSPGAALCRALSADMDLSLPGPTQMWAHSPVSPTTPLSRKGSALNSPRGRAGGAQDDGLRPLSPTLLEPRSPPLRKLGAASSTVDPISPPRRRRRRTTAAASVTVRTPERGKLRRSQSRSRSRSPASTLPGPTQIWGRLMESFSDTQTDHLEGRRAPERRVEQKQSHDGGDRCEPARACSPTLSYHPPEPEERAAKSPDPERRSVSPTLSFHASPPRGPRSTAAMDEGKGPPAAAPPLEL